MTRLAVGAGVAVWLGAALLLSSWSRLARPTLADRLRPFHPVRARGVRRPAAGSVASLGDLLGPMARAAGDRLASAIGVAEGAERRLRRIHSPVSATAFRLRQAAAAGLGAVTGGLVAVATGAPPVLSVLLVFGAPVLAFLVVEQRLARRSERWQRTTAEEMPVLADQLAMLLNSGFSLGAALARLAERGDGCVARDLESVVNRVQQGLSESAALREWSDRAGVDCVTRLVGVLTLHSAASDLGRLASAEARAARRDLHRRTIEQIERRAQQVWVPVTVATLVPGAILLAVPFLAALHTFANA